MRASRSSFLDHVKWLRKAVRTVGAELLVAGDSLDALIRDGERHWSLHPRFLTATSEGMVVTPELHDSSYAFLGWFPYRARSWPLAADPLQLVRFARSRGLPTPDVFADATPEASDVLLVRGSPAMGWTCEGPFRSAAERTLDPARPAYYQRFVEGDLLRAWFWGASFVCAELLAAPFVVGDGVATVRDLVLRRTDGARWSDHEAARVLASCEGVLRRGGATLATVVLRGARQPVGIAQGAPPFARGRLLDTTTKPEPPWLPVMRRAGPELLAQLPGELRADTLFTVDAVVDRQSGPSLVAMSASSSVQPLVYPAMVEGLVLPGRRAAAIAQEPAPVQQQP